LLLNSDVPIPEPCNVTEADPVEARLVCVERLARTSSKENWRDIVPRRLAIDSETDTLPDEPAPERQRTDDPETHSVALHLDTPSLSTEVSDCCPIFAPSTVRLNDPVAAELRARIKLTNPSSADTAEVAVPPLEPMLILSQREWLLPRPPKASRHVSAIQKDPSLAVRPTRTLPHAFHSPKPVPNTLTIADPVDTAFPAESTLVLRSASEKPSVKLRDTRPTVDSIRRLLPVP
jgi:hypothetical protein